MPVFIALISGVLFGIGLAMGGMLDPAKVVGFLDIFGEWDPSLAFVMGGGVIVNLIGYFGFIRRMDQPVCDARFHLPQKQSFDMQLIAGSALFGIGWGITGLCPGPAVASLFTNLDTGAIFLACVGGGLLAGKVISGQLRPA
jgi:uncharacterized membrane protein YedE/YeeE